MYGLGAWAEGLDIAASVVELRDQGFKGFRVWRGRPQPPNAVHLATLDLLVFN